MPLFTGARGSYSSLVKMKFPLRLARTIRRSARAHATIAAALVFWSATAIIVAVLLAHERREALHRASRNSTALAMVLEAHTARTFQAVDITLAGVADALLLAPALRKNDPRFQRTLDERLEALKPYVRAIFVIGADGLVQHDTDYPKTPNVSLADRPYFEAHRADPRLLHSVSSPLQSRSGLGWFLAVSRRIGDGPFKGIVVAALQPQYFETLYERMDLSEADVISLYHRDGTLIARYPGGAQEVGRSFAAFPMFKVHLPRDPSGSYRSSGGTFSFERLVSYRALEEAPLVVAVAQALPNLLDPWRMQAYGAAIALAALLLLLAALVTLFLRQQRLRDLARERAAQTEKLEALGHLTGSVSHDFGNLLNVISASLRVMTIEPQDRARAAEALAVADRAVKRGGQLIHRLASFARRQPLNVHAADLNTAIHDGGALLRQLIGPRTRIEEDLAPDLPPCLVDDTELEIALVNLLVNARDAGARRIVLRTGEHPSGHVCLSVQDDGSGMTDAVRRQAFEPYYTTKGVAGTGLGLSQVYGFMRQIGGEVLIDSRPGTGTTFHLLFPRAPAT
jgi:two-component system, NtrC family, sensor kinase